VLVQVRAAGVNPVDWKVRSGMAKEWLKHSFPLVLGWDLSGVVASPGAGVAEFKPGDEVYGMLDLSRNGAYAEYAIAKTGEIARKPKSVDHAYAAATPLAALTAWQALFDVAGLSSGRSVLILGGSGGVGHFAVQLAKWKGAKVAATTSERNTDFVRGLGAHQVIDYGALRLEDAIQAVDVVFDTVGGDAQARAWSVLKKGGILVSSVGIASPTEAIAHGARGEPVMVSPDASQLSLIAALIDSGQLKPFVQTVLPLREAAKAHALSEAGHVRGKIVLEVSEP